MHVKTDPTDDGGCLVCDECDLRPGHDGPCDCRCSDTPNSNPDERNPSGA